MIVINDLVYFYSDKSIFNYNPIDGSSSRIYHHPDITHRVTGLASLGANLVFVPGIQNPDAGKFHFPKNPDINSICMLKPDGSVAPLDKTAVQSTLDYSGSSIPGGDHNYIATVGSYVFFQENESVVAKEIPGRRIGGSNCILYRKENELFILEPSSYGDRVEELGFKLYKISPERKEIELAEEYRTNKLGRNFKRAEFDIFGDYVVVRGDGRGYVLKMKINSRRYDQY